MLADERIFYGGIKGFDGVYANGLGLEACREELEEVLDEWTLFRVSKKLTLPVGSLGAPPAEGVKGNDAG